MKRIALLFCLLASPALAQVLDLEASQALMFRAPARPEDAVITIMSGAYQDQKMVARMKMDGSVEFGEGFTADDAAREFWKNLGRAMPNKCEGSK